jgi:hypothetical protein
MVVVEAIEIFVSVFDGKVREGCHVDCVEILCFCGINVLLNESGDSLLCLSLCTVE